MRLSILIPSHNVGPRINVNLLNASLMARDDVEVIIRDNSGNAEKRSFISNINAKNCKIISSDECSPLENHMELLNESIGDFIFFVSDDDSLNINSISAIVDSSSEITNDKSFVGVTGIIISESQNESKISCMDKFESARAFDRAMAYIGNYPSVVQYAAIRRSLWIEILSFLEKLPIKFSYVDIIINVMILLSGRLKYINKFTYHYDSYNWSAVERCADGFANSFRQAGLDSSGGRLLWLIATFEGLMYIVKFYQGNNITSEERMQLALRWAQHHLDFFRGNWRHCVTTDSKYDAEAVALAEKWEKISNIDIANLISDIVRFLSLSSPTLAEEYNQFWS